MKTQVCIRCGEEKYLTAFPLTRQGNLSSRCTACNKKRIQRKSKKSNQKQREKFRQKQREIITDSLTATGKICNRCKKDLPLIDYPLIPPKNVNRSKCCLYCKREANRKNMQKVRKLRAKFPTMYRPKIYKSKKTREEINLKSKRYYQKMMQNSPEFRERLRKRSSVRMGRGSKNLDDYYIKHVLVTSMGISAKYIPPELILVERERIRLMRQLKEMQNEEHY